MRLKRDSLEADLAPAVGGAIAAFRMGGRPLFREPAPDARDATALGEFPMAPYVNRIAHGKFRWRNEEIALPRNRAEQAHPLHGIGWLRPWTCERLAPHAARMMLRCQASSDWPWAVTMARTVTLLERGLEVAFSLTNDDARPMPASIGLHPYFPSAGARVRLSCETMWLTIDDIPARRRHSPVVDALAAGAAVEGLDVDHCFAGWDGAAEINWPDLTLRIETDPPQSFVQLYTPRGRDFFCLEPQSAMPDAVNRTAERSGVMELSRDESLSFTARLTLT